MRAAHYGLVSFGLGWVCKLLSWGWAKKNGPMSVCDVIIACDSHLRFFTIVNDLTCV